MSWCSGDSKDDEGFAYYGSRGGVSEVWSIAMNPETLTYLMYFNPLQYVCFVFPFDDQTISSLVSGGSFLCDHSNL